MGDDDLEQTEIDTRSTHQNQQRYAEYDRWKNDWQSQQFFDKCTPREPVTHQRVAGRHPDDDAKCGGECRDLDAHDDQLCEPPNAFLRPGNHVPNFLIPTQTEAGRREL